MAHWTDKPHATIEIGVPLKVAGIEIADLECLITVADDGENALEIVEYFVDGVEREGKAFKRNPDGTTTQRRKLNPSPRTLNGVLHPTTDDMLRSAIDDAFSNDDGAQERAADALLDFEASARADYGMSPRLPRMFHEAAE